MRIRSAQKLIDNIAKMLPVGSKINGHLFIEALDKCRITYEIDRGNHKTLKHQAAITAINKGWNEKTALVLWVPLPSPDPPDPNDAFAVAIASIPPDPNDCLYIVLPNTTFKDIAKQVMQIAKLKAFL